jgi:phage-related protein
MAGFDGSSGCWWPSIPVTENTETRLRTTQFGDGYAQRVVDGINYTKKTWTLTFTMKPQDVIDAMDAFLTATKGTAFAFKHPVRQTITMVYCDKWNINWALKKFETSSTDFDAYGTLTCDFYTAISANSSGGP